ncbi:MAG: CsgG/HfaB family protein [Gemmatimonadota bacterium]|nr:CsgG/HfaB family protein [Gemmatimonadota bacterium]
MGDFLKRLAEKRIVQTAAVYAGGAWLLLEATDFFVDNYALSTRLLDVAVLLILLGFPAALIISWFHGERGRQEGSRFEVALLLTLAVLAALGTYRITVGGETPAGPERGSGAVSVSREARTAAEDLGEVSVAVLPFVNGTGQDSLDWLGPGLSDMLTSSLVRTGRLRVVSPQRLYELLRESGQEETGRIPDALAMDIASRSGARRMVRGSVLGEPGDLAVEAQLIDLRDGTVVAAERVRGDDVFDLSDSVAVRLSGHVLAAGAVAPTGPGDTAPRFAGSAPRPPIALLGDMDKLREFQAGIRSVWSALATDSIGARYKLVDLLEQMPGREQEVQHALEEILRIDSTQAKAWVELASVHARLGNERAADSALARHVEVTGDGTGPAVARGRVLESMGRADEARAAYRAALADAPTARRAMDRLAGTWLRAGDPVGARTAVEPWLSSDVPETRAEALILTGDAWAWEGRFDRAMDAYGRAARIGEDEDRPEIRADALEGEMSVRWVQDTTWGGSRLGRYRSVWTLLELERAEEARNLVEAAQRLQVDEADRLLPVDYHVILYARGRVAEALGRPREAAAAYRELVGNWGAALDEVPRLRDAAERLARLQA